MKQKIYFLPKNQLVFLFWFFWISLYAQNTNSQFKTYYEGKEFTSIAVDHNKNVWAGTDRQGLYFLNQKTNETTFTQLTIGTNPSLSSLRIQSLAVDKTDNIWIGHGGINVSNGQGGVERINVNSFDVQHLSPDRDMRGMSYLERDGLGTMNSQQIVVDSNNIVWVAHRYHDLTSVGAGGNSYIITPGTFARKRANNYLEKFDAVSTWRDYSLQNEDPGLPYPDYTYNPGPTDPVSTRICNAISAGKEYVWVSVHGYTSISQGFLPARILQYTPNGKFVKGHTMAESGFNSGMIFHAVYTNDKAVWTTTPIAGNGFSVYKDGIWHNINDLKIIPPNTRFNAKAIWGDALGRVYLGTNKGLIVFDGKGSPMDVNSYTLYTKNTYDSPRSKHQPELLSNNILSGVSEGKNSPFYSWITTPSGIIRGYLTQEEGIRVYTIRDRKNLHNEKVNDKENYIPIATLNYPYDEHNSPYFAVDGTSSTVIRYNTGVGIAQMFYNKEIKFRIRKEDGGDLPIAESNEKFVERYGKFELKPLDKYEENVYYDNSGNITLDSLKYVDVIYTHPSFISYTDYKAKQNHVKFQLQLIWDSESGKDPIVMFKHPAGFSLPPLLLGHGVWSDIFSLNNIEDYFNKEAG